MVRFQDGGRCCKLNWLLHQCQKNPDLSATTNTTLELSNHSIMVRSNLLKILPTSAATKRVEFFCIGKACTARKTKFSITDLCSIFDQIPSFLPIWSHLLKEFVLEPFSLAQCVPLPFCQVGGGGGRGAGKERRDFFQGECCNFQVRNKLKSGIFND